MTEGRGRRIDQSGELKKVRRPMPGAAIAWDPGSWVDQLDERRLGSDPFGNALWQYAEELFGGLDDLRVAPVAPKGRKVPLHKLPGAPEQAEVDRLSRLIRRGDEIG